MLTLSIFLEVVSMDQCAWINVLLLRVSCVAYGLLLLILARVTEYRLGDIKVRVFRSPARCTEMPGASEECILIRPNPPRCCACRIADLGDLNATPQLFTKFKISAECTSWFLKSMISHSLGSRGRADIVSTRHDHSHRSQLPFAAYCSI